MDNGTLEYDENLLQKLLGVKCLSMSYTGCLLWLPDFFKSEQYARVFLHVTLFIGAYRSKN